MGLHCPALPTQVLSSMDTFPLASVPVPVCACFACLFPLFHRCFRFLLVVSGLREGRVTHEDPSVLLCGCGRAGGSCCGVVVSGGCLFGFVCVWLYVFLQDGYCSDGVFKWVISLYLVLWKMLNLYSCHMFFFSSSRKGNANFNLLSGKWSTRYSLEICFRLDMMDYLLINIFFFFVVLSIKGKNTNILRRLHSFPNFTIVSAPIVTENG